jgi:hypothetical protein
MPTDPKERPTVRRSIHQVLPLGIPLLAALGLVIALSGQITDEQNGSDAQDNLEAGYNLAYFGVLSFDDQVQVGTDGLTLSNYREPFPIWVVAGYIALHPTLNDGLTADTLNTGEPVQSLKRLNLYWAALLLLAVTVLVWLAIRPPWLAAGTALVAFGLIHRYFLSQNPVINLMFTELEAATVLLWFSVTTVLALKTWHPGWFIASGVLIGLMALTKAVFLYVAVGVILTLLVVYLLRPGSMTRRVVLTRLVLLAVALAVVVLPWMTRNALLFDDFGITQRGGVILMIRAYLNTMTHDEWVGGFYHYTQAGDFKNWIGATLGYTPQDELTGRVMRLNRGNAFFVEDREADHAGKPDEAISYYRAGRAERVRLRNAFEEAGHPNPTHAADDALQSLAMDRILADPAAHLKVSVLMGWRGMWGMGTPAPFTLLAVFSLFAVTIIGLFRQEPWLLGNGLASFGAYLFYTLLTHFITRYLDPMVPLLLANMVIFAVLAAQYLYARVFRPAKPLNQSQNVSIANN